MKGQAKATRATQVEAKTETLRPMPTSMLRLR